MSITVLPTSRSGAPTVDRVVTRAYTVPTEQAEADGTLEWSETTAIVVTLSAGDAIGTGWTYGNLASLTVVDTELRSVVEDADPMDVPGTWESMVRHCRNLGTRGVVAHAISAVDVAMWDLKAKLLGVPLTQLLGRCRPAAPIYGSGGFTTYDDATLAAQVRHFTEDLGARCVKIKIGESWGHEVSRDFERVAVARVAANGASLFVDANGAFSRKQAVRIGRRLFELHGVSWFEEPVSSDDLDGLREVRDQVAADVTAGEYGYDAFYFERMCAAEAVDCLQADATRCGGYTGWMRAAAVAAAHGLEISAHCAPNLHAPVAVAVPNLRHIEYFHDHARLDELLFHGTVDPVGGMLRPGGDALGHGFELDEQRAEQFRLA